MCPVRLLRTAAELEIDMVASGEQQLRMFVIYAGQAGFHIALVPAHLSPEQVESALSEFGVDAKAVLELGDWKTTSDNVAVARVPFPRGN
jgi:hypothetical protein